MNCAEVQELLSAYFDGELADIERSLVSEHLAECPECAGQLAGFDKLAELTNTTGAEVPPSSIWSQLERQLQQDAVSELDRPRGTRSFLVARRFALAATILLALGVGFGSYRWWLVREEASEFTLDFGKYVETFVRDPNSAQQILLAKYENELVAPDQVAQRVGYRPAVANGLPDGYSIASTRVITMPCCTCVQSICKRDDGSTLAIFEHDDDETKTWFGNRPTVETRCDTKDCCLVGLDEQIAATWSTGSRHITLVGVRDISEIRQMVARLE